MLYHLFIAGRRICGQEGKEVTVTLELIFRFTTGAETEPLLDFQIAPSIIFEESGPGNFLPASNSCINQLVSPRAENLYKLPNEKDLFDLYDYAFLNSYFGQKEEELFKEKLFHTEGNFCKI